MMNIVKKYENFSRLSLEGKIIIKEDRPLPDILLG